jgi:hypothetical protein
MKIGVLPWIVLDDFFFFTNNSVSWSQGSSPIGHAHTHIYITMTSIINCGLMIKS